MEEQFYLLVGREIVGVAQGSQLLHDEHLKDFNLIQSESLPLMSLLTLSSLLLHSAESEWLGIPFPSAQNLMLGSSGTTTATVRDLRELPCTNI